MIPIKDIYSGCKNLNDQARSSRFNSMDFEAILLTIAANPTSNTRRVSGKLNGSQCYVIRHLDDLNKSIQRCRIVPHVTKILQNFWPTQVFSLCWLSFASDIYICWLSNNVLIWFY